MEVYDNQDKIKINQFNELEFKNVSFSYDNENNVLEDINIKIKKGDFIALVGESGSGKTTFSDLILNFYTLNQGLITVDDINIKDINVNSLRQRISLVSQDNILFDDTIYNNIKLGDVDADNEKIYESAKKANAYEFINKMPDKFQTNIGEKGVKISGGQKQRIAIARAIIKNPDILILDEATSSLDSRSEKKIQDAIDSLSKETTLIVIAHRLSTIQKANQILFFEEGKIIEMGTHDELFMLNKKYKKLYNLQFGAQDE